MNNCPAQFNCPNFTMTLDSFDPITNRFVDVGAGGPAPFTFEVSSNVSWLQFSTKQGSISPDTPEQRVWISVDWTQVEAGDNFAEIIFIPSAADGPGLTLGMRTANVGVDFVATKLNTSEDFHGTSNGDLGSRAS